MPNAKFTGVMATTLVEVVALFTEQVVRLVPVFNTGLGKGAAPRSGHGRLNQQGHLAFGICHLPLTVR
jgi:hypothetical protein